MSQSLHLRRVLAARLVQARTRLGISQRALGDKMGLGKRTGSTRINRYEHGVNSLTLDNLAELAKALEVPAAYLLAESDELADLILRSAE